MKLQTLQLFIRSLVEPIAQTCPTPESAEGLRRACDLFASLGDINVNQFADLLQQAKEYQDTKQHAFPNYLQPIIGVYENVRTLKSRSAADGANRDDLVRDLHLVPLDSLDVKDLTQLAGELGWAVKPKAKKPEVIDIFWVGITGEAKPKKATKSSAKAKSSVNLDEYAQKINDLKEQANSPSVSREHLERELKSLNLDKLAQKDLAALGKQLHCDVNAKTKKDAAIDAIERVVLEVKEMAVFSAG